MYNFLGKGGQRAARNRRRRRGLIIMLLLLLAFFAGIFLVLRLTCRSPIYDEKKREGADISDVIFGTPPREDRPLRPRLPLKKSSIDEHLDDKLKNAGPKRIPPHPILEIISPDGKTLMKKK